MKGNILNKVVVFAPHPDDETLGCGGALLRHQREGDEIHWCILTDVVAGALGFSQKDVENRESILQIVAKEYKFNSVYRLGYPAGGLDMVSLGDIIKQISDWVSLIMPNICYIPFSGDIHSDHRVSFDAISSSLKSFRLKSVKKILAYQTLSETDFSVDPTKASFRPNYWVDISDFLERKIEIMRHYKGELGEHPFPRNEKLVEALAALHGGRANCNFSEAYVLLQEIT